jgi:hypothetical protein
MGIDQVDQKQRAAAIRLLAAVEEDPELKEECCDYGNWYQHLHEHLEEKDES